MTKTEKESKQYKVIMWTLCGWEDCWKDGDEPTRFDSLEDAENGLEEYHQEFNQDGSFDRDDFKVVDANEPPYPD
jgi:hypothetical protein